MFIGDKGWLYYQGDKSVDQKKKVTNALRFDCVNYLIYSYFIVK